MQNFDLRPTVGSVLLNYHKDLKWCQNDQQNMEKQLPWKHIYLNPTYYTSYKDQAAQDESTLSLEFSSNLSLETKPISIAFCPHL